MVYRLLPRTGRDLVFTVFQGGFWLAKIDVLRYSGIDAQVLSKEEAKELLERYGIVPRQLPWLRASDPLVKALGAKPGDIVKIVRKSPIAGEAIVYRVVVRG